MARPMPPNPSTPMVLPPTLRPSGIGPLLPSCRHAHSDRRTGLARGGEHQPDGEVGDLVGQDAGGVGHRDAALARRRQIDGVGSNAEHRDQLEPGQRRDQCAVGAAIGLGRNPPHAGLELGPSASGAGRLKWRVTANRLASSASVASGNEPMLRTSMLHGRIRARRSASGSGAGIAGPVGFDEIVVADHREDRGVS